MLMIADKIKPKDLPPRHQATKKIHLFFMPWCLGGRF
jgi:hypothetical protein